MNYQLGKELLVRSRIISQEKIISQERNNQLGEEQSLRKRIVSKEKNYQLGKELSVRKE